ncbi:MAG: hypothetical protein JXA18_09010 [Chitinispirillaceae bacterium]|nr:hypothetical protein [Chitinispirillaceae bacterium]
MNVHVEHYNRNKEHLEKRFPLRSRNKPWIYVYLCIIVFGAFILTLLSLLKCKKFPKSYREIAGWDVTIATCVLNLVFAYGFGFVAVVNDWWFFFPDLHTGIIWKIGNGQMVLGDVVFYVLAVIMGHCAVIIGARAALQLRPAKAEALLKGTWILIAMTIVVFGMPFGSQVMKGMVLWLYIPFGLFSVILFRRYTALQIWLPTLVFITCEFLWDIFARIYGIWIFPDAATHPGLYFKEILLFQVGTYPIIWQPEMTQMAFISGMISLTFFLGARTILRDDPIV